MVSEIVGLIKEFWAEIGRDNPSGIAMMEEIRKAIAGKRGVKWIKALWAELAREDPSEITMRERIEEATEKQKVEEGLELEWLEHRGPLPWHVSRESKELVEARAAWMAAGP